MPLEHKKLFIPGPVEIAPEILEAMATPMVGHRMKEYALLHAGIKSKLKCFRSYGGGCS
jgi:aspartate aminotransferase-like enzyme